MGSSTDAALPPTAGPDVGVGLVVPVALRAVALARIAVRAVPEGVLVVLARSPVLQVAQLVVEPISVQVPDLDAFGGFPQEGEGNKPVKLERRLVVSSPSAEANRPVALIANRGSHELRATSPVRHDATEAADLVVVEVGDRPPLLGGHAAIRVGTGSSEAAMNASTSVEVKRIAVPLCAADMLKPWSFLAFFRRS